MSHFTQAPLKILAFMFMILTQCLAQAQTTSLNEAILAGRNNNFLVDLMEPSDVQTLLQSRQPAPNEDRYRGFIQVYIQNSRGQLIPTYVQERTWDPNRPGARYSPFGPQANDQAWVRGSDGQLRLVTCQEGRNNCSAPAPVSQQTRTCQDNRLLPPGMTFDQIRGSGFDCRSDAARGNDFLALACNLYFESRGEGAIGKRVVAEVTLNRTRNNAVNNRAGRTVREVVFAPYQFSWTLEPAVVRFREGGSDANQAAWLEALSVARLTYNPDSNGVPIISNPRLICYDYYLSLDKFQTVSSFPSWARHYYGQALLSRDPAMQPLCVGVHIFMRNPEGRCDTQQRAHNAEGDDLDTALRNSFYRECLGQSSVPAEVSSPETPRNSVCRGQTLEEAACAQLQAHNVVNPGGGRVTCGDSPQDEPAAPEASSN